jgi:fumarate hydratase subunit beta
MDKYTPALIKSGISGMIGKGMRDENVIRTMIEHGAVYFGAVGGTAALISKCIKSQKVIAFEDLGTEAVRILEVIDFPAVVLIDRYGNNLYETGRQKYTVKNE